MAMTETAVIVAIVWLCNGSGNGYSYGYGQGYGCYGGIIVRVR